MYSSIHSFPLYWIEFSGKLHVPAALIPDKRLHNHLMNTSEFGKGGEETYFCWGSNSANPSRSLATTLNYPGSTVIDDTSKECKHKVTLETRRDFLLSFILPYMRPFCMYGNVVNKYWETNHSEPTTILHGILQHQI
jgi:hypothetical protein